MRISISIPQNPHKDTISLSHELLDILPGSLMDIDESDVEVKITEDIKPQWIILKSNDLQLVFKIITYKSREYLRVSKPISRNNPPQLVVNNFTTDIGTRVVEFLSDMFPFNKESRQVANFTVQGDFIYFRLYKYCFGEKCPIMENVGPHLTLRLWRMTECNGDEKNVMNFKRFIKNAGIL